MRLTENQGNMNMTTLRCLALVSLGIASCIGCGDSSPQAWESQSPGGKKDAKVDGLVNNDLEETNGVPDNPHRSINPHVGMQMPEGGAGAEMENTGKLDIGTVHFSVPKSWIRKAPLVSEFIVIQAEYRIPKAEADKADGRLTVSTAKNTLEVNVKRWEDQFSAQLDKESRETIDADGVKITLIDLAGTYDEMMGQAPPHPDYRMLGAIFQLPGEKELHFIKCYGPVETITAHADEIKEFLKSLKVDK